MKIRSVQVFEKIRNHYLHTNIYRVSNSKITFFNKKIAKKNTFIREFMVCKKTILGKNIKMLSVMYLYFSVINQLSTFLNLGAFFYSFFTPQNTLTTHKESDKKLTVMFFRVKKGEKIKKVVFTYFIIVAKNEWVCWCKRISWNRRRG